MIFEIEHQGKLSPVADEKLDSAVVDELTDLVMDNLLESEAIDPDVSGSLASGDVVIRMGVEAASPSAALAKADILVRSALHAAGIATPGWRAPKRSLSFQDGSWHVTPPGKRLVDAS